VHVGDVLRVVAEDERRQAEEPLAALDALRARARWASEFGATVVPVEEGALRLVLGPAHRLLLPAAALGGATLLVLADLLARTVVAPREIPLGVLTALIGSPVFFWLLRREHKRRGAWA